MRQNVRRDLGPVLQESASMQRMLAPAAVDSGQRRSAMKVTMSESKQGRLIRRVHGLQRGPEEMIPPMCLLGGKLRPSRPGKSGRRLRSMRKAASQHELRSALQMKRWKRGWQRSGMLRTTG
ncbi:hypothetical protein N183_34995 [Sinorhizobium sp. Sb3]|nr:hypothetical protein N183_34995 [Sinorhizobium sp. Sb3]